MKAQFLIMQIFWGGGGGGKGGEEKGKGKGGATVMERNPVQRE